MKKNAVSIILGLVALVLVGSYALKYVDTTAQKAATSVVVKTDPKVVTDAERQAITDEVKRQLPQQLTTEQVSTIAQKLVDTAIAADRGKLGITFDPSTGKPVIDPKGPLGTLIAGIAPAPPVTCTAFNIDTGKPQKLVSGVCVPA